MSFREFVDELGLLVRSRYGLILVDTWKIDASWSAWCVTTRPG